MELPFVSCRSQLAKFVPSPVWLCIETEVFLRPSASSCAPSRSREWRLQRPLAARRHRGASDRRLHIGRRTAAGRTARMQRTTFGSPENGPWPPECAGGFKWPSPYCAVYSGGPHCQDAENHLPYWAVHSGGPHSRIQKRPLAARTHRRDPNSRFYIGRCTAAGPRPPGRQVAGRPTGH